MNKKRIIKISTFLFLILVLTPILVWGASSSTLEMDLAKVKKVTLNNNKELYMILEKIHIEEKRYDNGTDNSIDKDKSLVKLYKLDFEKQEKEDEITLKSINLYHKLLLKRDLIEIEESKLRRLNKGLEIKEANIQGGAATESSIIDEEIAIKQQEANITKLKSEEKVLSMELNINMGYALDNKLVLEEESIPYKTYTLEKFEETMEKIVKSYPSLVNLIEERRILGKEQEATSDDKSKEELGDKIVELHYDIQQKKADLEVKGRGDYNNLLNLKNDVEIKNLEYEKNLANLKIEKVKYEIGQITELEYKASEYNVNYSLIKLKEAKLQYYIAVEGFKNFIKKVG